MCGSQHNRFTTVLGKEILMLKHDKHIGKEMHDVLRLIPHELLKGQVNIHLHSRNHTLEQDLQAHIRQDIGIHYRYAWLLRNLMIHFFFHVDARRESTPEGGCNIMHLAVADAIETLIGGAMLESSQMTNIGAYLDVVKV